MYMDIQNATIAYNDENLKNFQGKWFGMFSMLDILLGVRAVLNDGNLLFFNVLSNGRLEETSIEDDVLQIETIKRIGVVMHVDTKWHIDQTSNLHGKFGHMASALWHDYNEIQGIICGKILYHPKRRYPFFNIIPNLEEIFNLSLSFLEGSRYRGTRYIYLLEDILGG